MIGIADEEILLHLQGYPFFLLQVDSSTPTAAAPESIFCLGSNPSQTITQSLKNLDYAKTQGKGYILYMSGATSAQVKEATKQGVTIIKSEEYLRKAIGS